MWSMLFPNRTDVVQAYQSKQVCDNDLTLWQFNIIQTQILQNIFTHLIIIFPRGSNCVGFVKCLFFVQIFVEFDFKWN